MKMKFKALHAAALLSAVSGATLIMTASTPVQAAEESCWEQPKATTARERHLRGCAFNQYGLSPGLRPADGGAENGGGGVRPSPGPGPNPGPTPPDPDPTPPYTNGG